MAKIADYAKMANAVYESVPVVQGWTLWDIQRSGGWLAGAFQGAAFKLGNEIVVAFKGTSQARDVAADLKLGVGMNTSQYASAGHFVADLKLPKDSRVTLCGHSLGGAMAQTIGNRQRLPFATFNAPGVGLFSKNKDQVAATLLTGTALIRAAGTVLSTVRHPVQAIQDLASVGYHVRGVNFRVGKDLVGSLGVHFGRVIELPYAGGSLDIGKKHKMETVLAALTSAGYDDVLLDTLID